MVDQTVYGNANFGIIIGFLTKAMLVSRIHGAVTGIKTYLLNKKRKMNKGMSAGILGVNILNLLTDPSKNHPLKDTLKGAALNVPNIDFEDGTGVNGDVKEKYQELQTLPKTEEAAGRDYLNKVLLQCSKYAREQDMASNCTDNTKEALFSSLNFSTRKHTKTK